SRKIARLCRAKDRCVLASANAPSCVDGHGRLCVRLRAESLLSCTLPLSDPVTIRWTKMSIYGTWRRSRLNPRRRLNQATVALALGPPPERFGAQEGRAALMVACLELSARARRGERLQLLPSKRPTRTDNRNPREWNA